MELANYPNWDFLVHSIVVDNVRRAKAVMTFSGMTFEPFDP